MDSQQNNVDYKSEIQKAQNVRLWDIFFIAPVLIIIALLPSTPWWARLILIGIGAGTFIYNGYRYLKYKKL